MELFEEIVTPWENPKDLLDRKKYAVFLTNYLSQKDKPFVLNLNAGWGMGKTFFLSHWYKEISKTHPTVYVNAWETDFSDDPLLAVMNAVQERFCKDLSETNPAVTSFKEALKAGGKFIKGIAPIVGKGVASKLLGGDAGKELADYIQMRPEELAELAGQSMQLMLKDHSDKMDSVAKLRDALRELITQVTTDDLKKPLFIFIDELDRCRPTYAIEMLETVKHLFSVEGAVFVIATDSEQLQHSIKAVYGNDFNGGEYLRRFFDQDFTMPAPDYRAYCDLLTEVFHHSDRLDYNTFQPWNVNGQGNRPGINYSKKQCLSAFLSLYAQHYNISLRSLDQVMVRLNSIMFNSRQQLFAPWLLLLIIIQAKEKSSLRWLMDRVNFNDISKQLNNIEAILIAGGETIGWSAQVLQEQENVPFTHNIVHYSVSDIGTQLIQAMATVKNSNKAKLSQLGYDESTLQNYFQSKLRNKQLGDQSFFYDLENYSDYVEMAGALS